MTSPPVLIPKDAFFIFFLHGSSTRSGTQFRQEPPFPVRSNPICSPSRKEPPILSFLSLMLREGQRLLNQARKKEHRLQKQAKPIRRKTKVKLSLPERLNCALTWRESVKGSLNSPCPKDFMNRSSVCPTKSSSPKLHYWERFTAKESNLKTTTRVCSGSTILRNRKKKSSPMKSTRLRSILPERRCCIFLETRSESSKQEFPFRMNRRAMALPHGKAVGSI